MRFEAGSEGKRAKIKQKAATVDFTVYPAKFEPNLKLTNEEIEWLNNYHQTVYEKLSPDLNEEEKVWLQEATASL